MPPDLRRWPVVRSLTAATQRPLGACSRECRFAAGDLLLEGGSHAEWLHVISRGLVREYYVMPSGEEHTRVFVSEGGVTGSLLDLTSSAPSVTWIQALEPTQTLAIRYDDFNVLAERCEDLAVMARRQAEALALRKTKREYEMLALSASERLASWKVEHPELDGRITRRLLASYLGISPVHLSRISAKAATERLRERARPRR